MSIIRKNSPDYRGEIAGLTRIIESLENAETDTPSAI